MMCYRLAAASIVMNLMGESECAGSEGRALRRQSLQDRMKTMTPGPMLAPGVARVAAPRMTRSACRKLAIAG